MDLLINYPDHPNQRAGLTKVFAEYYLMHSAFSWLEEIYDLFTSFFQGIIGFFSTKEQTDF